MSQTLFTLSCPNRHQVTVRKSRFLAQVAPVADVDAARDFLAGASDDDAGQHCWAWRIGQDYRFDDDHEPAGSAGKPILAAIDGQHLDRIVAVVARWFGGTKLGIGGLMRAYGGTAAECMRRGERVPIIARTELVLECAYGDFALIKSRLADMQGAIHHENFGTRRVVVHLSLPDRHVSTLRRLVADVTHGQGHVRDVAATDESG
jgi:uncharacterized YigZ family protein